MAELHSTTISLLQKDIEGNCSFCLQRLNTRPEVRRMPCDHNSCTGCLKEILSRGNKIKCSESECKKIQEDIKLEDIPVIYVRQVYECSGKHGGKQCDEDPESFCTKCHQIFCRTHQGWHADLHAQHEAFIISIEQYRLEADRLTARHCTDHTTEEISTACSKCKKPFCARCLSKDKHCPDMSAHDIVGLREVAELVREKIKADVQTLLEFDGNLDVNLKLSNKRIEILTQRQLKVKKQLRETVEKAINEMREALRQTEEEIDEKTEVVMMKLREFERDATPVQKAVRDTLVECSDLASGNDIDVIRRPQSESDKIKNNYSETNVPTVPTIPIYSITNLSETSVYRWKLKVADTTYTSIGHKSDFETNGQCYTVAHFASGSLVHGGLYLAGPSLGWNIQMIQGVVHHIYEDELSGQLFILSNSESQKLVYEIDPVSLKSTCIIKYADNHSDNLQHITANKNYIITTDIPSKGLKVFDRFKKTHLYDIKLDMQHPMGVEFLDDNSAVVGDIYGKLQAITINETPQILWETNTLRLPSGIHIDHNRNHILVCCNDGTQLYILSLVNYLLH